MRMERIFDIVMRHTDMTSCILYMKLLRFVIALSIWLPSFILFTTLRTT